MKIKCPQCQQSYEVESSISGRPVECECGARFSAVDAAAPLRPSIDRPPVADREEFKIPVLALVLKIIGIACLVIPVILMIHSVTQKMTDLLPFVIPVLISSIPWFILASIITLLAKIEYNTRK